MSYGPTNSQIAVLLCTVAALGYAVLRAGEVVARWVFAHLAWN